MQAVSNVRGISRLLRSPIFLSLHRQISGLAQRNYSSDADNVEATPTEAVEDLYDKMLEYVMKALWKHTVHGLAPSVASAHHTLTYAKNNNDTNLWVEVMKLFKRNDLPLQPGTADIVFSCYNTNECELINKYAKRFVKAGVKLRQTSFETWMQFAAKRGDTEILGKVEQLRSDSMKPHTLATGFSCAKTLSDAKKSGMKDELQKLVSEWPLEVLKHKNEGERKADFEHLKVAICSAVYVMQAMGSAILPLLSRVNNTHAEGRFTLADALVYACNQGVDKTLSDAKKSGMKDELQKLVSEWPLEVLKHKNEGERKADFEHLKVAIYSAVYAMQAMGSMNYVIEHVNNTDAEGRLTLADALVYACNQGVDKVNNTDAEGRLTLADALVYACNQGVDKVNNTDAEGRLTLADALVYACNQGVDKVNNTDAEGRLTLADALVYACNQGVDKVRDVLEASELSGEKLRRLPIRESYKPPIGTINTKQALVGKGFNLDRYGKKIGCYRNMSTAGQNTAWVPFPILKSEKSQPERAWQPFWVSIKKRHGKRIRMKLHTEGTLLVNTDACHDQETKKFFFGALVRDSNFQVLSSYYEQENYESHIGKDSQMAYIAEVKGIYKVLDFCKEKKYDKIMLVSDNLNAMRMLNKVDQVDQGDEEEDIAKPTLQLILELKRHFGNIVLCYAPRELNEAADYLANLAKANLAKNVQEDKRVEDPPVDEVLSKCLEDDKEGKWFKRKELSAEP